jgi:hypothetical protein
MVWHNKSEPSERQNKDITHQARGEPSLEAGIMAVDYNNPCLSLMRLAVVEALTFVLDDRPIVYGRCENESYTSFTWFASHMKKHHQVSHKERH